MGGGRRSRARGSAERTGETLVTQSAASPATQRAATSEWGAGDPLTSRRAGRGGRDGTLLDVELSAMTFKQLSGIILDAAIQVHRALGPGLLEKAYEFALMTELEHRGLRVRRQVPVSVWYRNRELPNA